MTWPLELLDQLLGDDLTLDIVAQIYPDAPTMKKIVKHFIADGFVEVVDAQGRPLELWEWDALCRERVSFLGCFDYTARLTDAGAEFIGG